MDKDGLVTRITSIAGKVLWAKNLPDMDDDGKSDPYCVMKAIRQSGNLVTLARTQVVYESLAPVWDEDFNLHIPRNFNHLVGIRFSIYDFDDHSVDGDDFLGYCDVDVAAQRDDELITFEGDLVGGPHSTGRKKKRGRLCIEYTVTRRRHENKSSMITEIPCPIRDYACVRPGDKCAWFT